MHRRAETSTWALHRKGSGKAFETSEVHVACGRQQRVGEKKGSIRGSCVRRRGANKADQARACSTTQEP
eukprot:7716641-Prorocentrum_lima.AAC.1